MSLAVDPVIHDRLTRFAQRQRRWTLLRAGLVALVVWLLAILVVTGIDAVWVLERAARAALTLAAYALAAVVFLRLAVPRSGQSQRLRHAAVAWERARPELRDRLLSAVELAQAAAGDSGDATGSRAFIQATQREVALRLRGADVRQLLPLRLLRRPLIAAAVLLAAALALLLIPDLQYGQRLARAVVPGIDLDRVSQTRISILRPDPASRAVPAEELTAVAIQTTGRPAAEGRLQWEAEDGRRGSLAMRPLDDPLQPVATDEASSVLAANLPVGQVPLRYRITAGDGVTAWHRLAPFPRPRAVEFEKSITPPPYSGLPAQHETSADGRLEGLRGSTVRLRVRFDMPVVDATVRVVGEELHVPMDGAGSLWSVTLPLEQNDRYQVLARSEATGFDNPLSPQYAIVPLVDQPPQLRWLEVDPQSGRPLVPAAGEAAQPDAARRLVTSQATLALAAEVTDEMPVSQLVQETAINAGPWQVSPATAGLLPAEHANDVRAWAWDVTTAASESAPLRPGDLIRTRVVATDRKGQRGESTVREYLISDQAFDVRRRATVQAWAELATRTEAWRQAVTEELIRLGFEPPAEEPAAAPEPPPAPDAPPAADTPPAPLAQQTSELLERLAQMTRTAAHDAEAGELELLGRGIFRIDARLRQAATAEGPLPPAASLDSLRRSARWIAEAAAYGTAHRLSLTVADDLQRILVSMQPLVAEDSVIQWESFPRYHRVTQQQFREVLALIAQVQRTLPASTRNHHEQLRRWIQRWLDQLEAHDTPDVGEARIRTLTHELRSDLESRRRVAMLDGRLPSRQVEAHQRLHELGGWNAPALDRAEQIAKQFRDSHGSGDASQAEPAAELQLALNLTLRALAEQLESDAAMNLRRPEADRRYVADARMLRRVLDRLIATDAPAADDLAPTDDTVAGDTVASNAVASDLALDEVLGELGLAFHQLEAGHWWTQGLAELRALADDQRWDIDSADARLDAPMRWERVQRGLELALLGLEQAQVPEAVRQSLQQPLRDPATTRLARSLTSRRWQPTPTVSVADELEAKHAELQAGSAALVPVLAAARRRIAAYLPDLAEMADGAAKTLRQAEQTARAPAPRSPQQAAEEIRQQHQRAQQQAEALREALADQASVQDLTTTAGLRAARDADIAAQAIAQQLGAADAAVQQAAEQAHLAGDPASAEQAVQAAAAPLDAAAQTLERIAAHYAQVAADAAGDPAQAAAAPASLADLEQELGLRQQMDEAFARSQSLADSLNHDPRGLLKKLAEELERNRRMQQELSEITAQSLQDALRTLHLQAERERGLRLELEKRDPRTAAEKQRLQETIQAAVDQIAAVQRSRLHAAKQATGRLGEVPDPLAESLLQTAEELETASGQLRQTAADAGDAADVRTGSQALLEDLRQQAERISSELNDVAQTLQQSQQRLQPLTTEPAAALPPDQQLAEQRDMQTLQRQARDALAGAVRNRQNRQSPAAAEAGKQVQQLRSQLRQAEEQLHAAEQQLAEQPQDRQLQQRRNTAAARVHEEQLRLELAEQDAQRRRETLEQTRQQLAEISRTPLPPLQGQRPAAELAQAMLQQATEDLRSAQAVVAAAIDASDQRPPLRATTGQLQASEQVQSDVQRQVQRAAEDLQRAARHHERLGDPQTAEPIRETAEAVEQIAQQEIARARDALAQAAQLPSDPAHPTADATAADAALGAAEQAIGMQAEALGAVIAQAATAATDAAPPGDAEADAARQLARTLDELDRSLNQLPPPDGDPPSPEDGQAASDSGPGEPAPQADQPGPPGQPGQEGPPGEQGQPGQPGQDGQSADQGAAGTPSSPTLAAAARRQMQQLALQRMLPGEAKAGEDAPGAAPQGQPQTGAGGAGTSATSGGGSQGSDAGRALPPGLAGDGDGDWARLRSLQADDTTVGRRSEISPEYRRQIEAYFRALAEQAKGDEQP